MRKTFLLRAMTCVVAAFSLIIVSSCIDKKYNLSPDNFDLNVHIFEEGICLPLGSTDTITLGYLISKMDLSEDFQDVFKTDENGSYSFSYGPETKDLSDKLSSLSDAVDIDMIDFSRSVDFNLSGVDVGDIKYEGGSYGFEKDLSKEISEMDVSIPPIKAPFNIDANIRSFNLGDAQWDVNVGNQGANPNFAYVPESLEIPAALLANENLKNYVMPVSQLNDYLQGGAIGFNASVEDVAFQTELNNTFPKDVLSVSDMRISENARLRITVAIDDPFFISGKIIPHLDLDLSSIFRLKNNGTTIQNDHIIADFVLSPDSEDPWVSVGEFGIEGIVINDGDWTYPDPDDPESVLMLHKKVDIEVDGSLGDEDLTTSLATLDAWMQRHPVVDGKRNLDVSVNIEFVDFTIDDVALEFRPKSIERQEMFDIELPAMELPSMVTKVDNVVFTESSVINFTLSAENLKSLGEVDFDVHSLELIFPEKFIIEGADENNRLIFGDVNLREKDMMETVVVKGYKLDQPDENGRIPAYVGTVNVIAKGEVSGKLHTGNLPETADEDVKLKGLVEGEIEIGNFDATLSGYEVSPETDPDVFKAQEIKIEIPEALSDVKGLVVYLENDPEITIDIDLPNTSFDVRPMNQDGLVLHFPEMLQFEEGANYERWFDKDKNALVFSSEEDFPDEVIHMPIKNIVINPEKGADGKWYSTGEVRIDGAVGIKEGEIVTKTDLDNLSNEGAVVKFEAVIPVLTPATVGMDSYSTPLDFSFDFAPFKEVELPEMLESVNDIVLDDVYLSLEMKTAKGFPSIGDDAVLSLGIDIELPEFIKVEDERYKDGKLEISENFKKSSDGLELMLKPIKIGVIDLNMSREQLASLEDSIVIKGNATLTGAELDIDEWVGTSQSIDIQAYIRTIKEDIGATDKLFVKEITGVVNYEMEPMEFPVDLSEIASAIQNENLSMSFDFKTFYLGLGLKTNIGVPVDVDLYVTPYFGGEPGTTAHQPLRLKPASSSELQEMKYWISNTPPAEGMGYEHLDKLNIFKLIFADETRTVIADSLKVSLSASVGSDQECRFEPGADYKLIVDYMAGMPLEFGDNFKIEYRHVIEDLSPEIVKLFGYASIGLGGSVESSIPLNFNLQVNMLDADGNPVEMVEGAGRFTVKGSSIAGEPTKTPVNLVFGKKAGAEEQEISAVEIVVSTDAKEVSGPFNEKSSIRCVLNARIPEGISTDLRKLLEDDIVKDEGTNE